MSTYHHNLHQQIITVLSEPIRGKKGDKRMERIAMLRTGMTVAEYLESGGKIQELAWEMLNGTVVLSYIPPGI